MAAECLRYTRMLATNPKTFGQVYGKYAFGQVYGKYTFGQVYGKYTFGQV